FLHILRATHRPLVTALRSTLFPYTTLFRSRLGGVQAVRRGPPAEVPHHAAGQPPEPGPSAAHAGQPVRRGPGAGAGLDQPEQRRSEEHTSERQSPDQLVCRLLLEKNTPLIK